MNKEIKIIVGIIVIAILVSIFVIMWIFINSGLRPCCGDEYTINLTEDSTKKTLTVTHIGYSPKSLNWSDIEVRGNATLPTGTIDIGDIITNCSGEVVLIFLPENILIGDWIFEG